MRVQQVAKVNFGHVIVADSGASNREQGSLKLALASETTGQELNTFQGTVSDAPFRSSDDYLQGLTRRIVDFEGQNVNKIAQLSEADRRLGGIVIFPPGATDGTNRAGVLPNLVSTDGKSLTNIDFNTILPNVRQALQKRGVECADGFKLLAANDMIGAGSSIARQLTEAGSLKDGYQAAFYMAGGGLGAGEIQVVDDTVLVKSTESGHTRISGAGKSLQTAESAGASSTALIRNFARALGFSDEKTAALIGTGNAKIPMSFAIDTGNVREIEALRNTNAFNETDSLVVDGDRLFRLKGVSEKAHQQASKKAVDRFIDVMAGMSADRAVEGVNQVILTGPLTRGIAKDLEHNPQLFGRKSLIELIATRMHNFLDQAGRNMASLNGFTITDAYKLGNNTEGGLVALKGKFTKGRGNWLQLPLDALNQIARRV